MSNIAIRTTNINWNGVCRSLRKIYPKAKIAEFCILTNPHVRWSRTQLFTGDHCRRESKNRRIRQIVQKVVGDFKRPEKFCEKAIEDDLNTPFTEEKQGEEKDPAGRCPHQQKQVENKGRLGKGLDKKHREEEERRTLTEKKRTQEKGGPDPDRPADASGVTVGLVDGKMARGKRKAPHDVTIASSKRRRDDRSDESTLRLTCNEIWRSTENDEAISLT